MTEPMSINELAAIQAAKFVNDFWENHMTSTSHRRTRLLDWYKQYRGIPNRRSYPGRANVFVNETLSAVESVAAQETAAIFAEPRYLMLVGREPTDELQTKILEEAMFYYLDTSAWKSKCVRFLRQKGKYGTCFAETGWETEEGLLPRRVPGSAIPKVTNTRLKDRPTIRYVDELDIALDYGKSDIQEMDGVVIRKRITWDFIKKRERQGVFSASQVLKIKRGEPYAGLKGYDYMGGRSQRFMTMGVNLLDFDTKEYELLSYWGKVPRWWVEEGLDIDSPEAEEMVPGVIECILRGPCVRLGRNPFWHQEIPVVMAPHIPVDDEAYGMGICEIVEYLQQELNDKRNQILDHATDQIKPPLIENRAAGIGEIRWEPQFRIKSNLPGDQALKALYPGGNPAEVVMMEERVKQDMRNEAAANDPIQGIRSNKESTAFEVNQIQARGSLRIAISTTNFGDQFLKRVYRQVYKLIQQFTDQDTMIRIIGSKGVKWEKLTPEMVSADMDVIPKIAPDADNRMMVRTQMIQFLQAIAPVYPRINAAKIAHRIYELFGWEDADEVVPLPSGDYDQGELSDEETMRVLFMGQRVTVNIMENHPQKLSALIQFMAQFESKMTPQAIEAFKDAIRQHMHYLQAIQGMSGMIPPPMSVPPRGAGAPSSNGKTPASQPNRGPTQMLRSVSSPSAGT